MHAPRHLSLLALGGLTFAVACGGFNNGPLEEGTVRGRLVGADARVAKVNVLGLPSTRADVSPDGRFELHGVPATAVELFMVASSTRAARTKVVAQGARITDLGDIVAPLGSFITVRLRDRGGNVPKEGEVEVDGTAFDDLLTDASTGEVRVGPLAEGCYTLEAKADKLAEVEQEVCVGVGEELVRDIVLGDDDDDDGGIDDDG
ncbi:carboxypeptidase regulatory-like domain-containing protein [Myxococcus stipitatus]|uniref:carboxypeptidase regulatory-like domain-containing protein n=1 Tax=Myxococcus stipitatus TaxID=83455 RepID=UPI0031455231